ncbi:MAG: hypothetical protein AAF514_20400 [Verrucomicrobiota bacterium]
MVAPLLSSFSWLLTKTPEPILEGICRGLGCLVYHLPSERSHLVKSNLHHAFPERSEAWRRKIGRLTFARFFEMALYGFGARFFDEEWVKTHFLMEEDDRRRMEVMTAGETPAVVLLPHVTLAEILCATPVILPEARGSGVVYRPLTPPSLDTWVKEVRERWGIVAISRNEGVGGMNTVLRDERKGVCLLYDQNTGKKGSMHLFLGRVASSTPLPGLLARRFKANLYFVVPRRIRFWTAQLSCRPLTGLKSIEDITLKSQQCLEDYLRGSDEQCAEWLWAHGRWGALSGPRKRFGYHGARLFMDPENIGPDQRKTRFWIRLPNWLGDVVMALPFLRALRQGRPDAELTLLARPHFLPLLEKWGVADRTLPLPDKGRNPVPYFRSFYRLRHQYPDTWVSFTNSPRSDLEAFAVRAPQRFGMLRPGRRRPLLTHSWKMPADLDEAAVHQTEVWHDYFRHFGLEAEPDFSAFGEPSGGKAIGMICGTENAPEKRWPVPSWRTLIEQILERSQEKRGGEVPV